MTKWVSTSLPCNNCSRRTPMIVPVAPVIPTIRLRCSLKVEFLFRRLPLRSPESTKTLSSVENFCPFSGYTAPSVVHVSVGNEDRDEEHLPGHAAEAGRN